MFFDLDTVKELCLAYLGGCEKYSEEMYKKVIKRFGKFWSWIVFVIPKELGSNENEFEKLVESNKTLEMHEFKEKTETEAGPDRHTLRYQESFEDLLKGTREKIKNAKSYEEVRAVVNAFSDKVYPHFELVVSSAQKLKNFIERLLKERNEKGGEDFLYPNIGRKDQLKPLFASCDVVEKSADLKELLQVFYLHLAERKEGTLWRWEKLFEYMDGEAKKKGSGPQYTKHLEKKWGVLVKHEKSKEKSKEKS